MSKCLCCFSLRKTSDVNNGTQQNDEYSNSIVSITIPRAADLLYGGGINSLNKYSPKAFNVTPIQRLCGDVLKTYQKAIVCVVVRISWVLYYKFCRHKKHADFLEMLIGISLDRINWSNAKCTYYLSERMTVINWLKIFRTITLWIKFVAFRLNDLVVCFCFAIKKIAIYFLRKSRVDTSFGRKK